MVLTNDELITIFTKQELIVCGNRKIRNGQAFFNALNSFRPDIANEVRNSPIDPFYKDSNIKLVIQKYLK